MNKKFVFDLDGVLRELYIPLEKMYNYKITAWDTLYKGKDVVELIDEKLSILLKAPSSKYLNIVKKCFDEIEIWTWQKKSWRKNTLKWINKNFKNKKVKVRFLTMEQKAQRLKENKNIYLVEDYPMYRNYNRIILIDKIYNKKSKAKIRVKKVRELEKILERGGEK